MRRTTFGLLLGMFCAAAKAQSTGSTTQSVSITINPIGKLSVPSTVTLSGSGSAFSSFQGSLLVNYRERTSATGSGTITLQAGSDFSPTGGPAISGNTLSFTCGAAGLGTGCASSQTVSTTAQATVVQVGASACTGGGSPCSATNPTSVQVNFTLINTPSYNTGAYSAQLTFTISAF